jgi:holo-[acyl-carrier protein] synthase
VIIGIGVDLEEVARIAAMTDRWGERFTARVFTPGERAFAGERAHAAQHLAARFAAKEATLKALGVPGGLSWKELEVIGGGTQAPRLVLHGRAAEAARRLGATRLHLTLTPAAGVAGAMVIAESA